jgi:bifunctional DNase/RNase
MPMGVGLKALARRRGEDPAAPLGCSHVREICDGLDVSVMKEYVTDVSTVVYVARISHRSSRRTPPP